MEVSSNLTNWALAALDISFPFHLAAYVTPRIMKNLIKLLKL
jgi:hypothetical protein